MVPCRNSWGKVMEKGKEKAYIKGFLVEALINAMPLKEATLIVDRLLPLICRELESSDRRIDEYAIKVAFAKSIIAA